MAKGRPLTNLAKLKEIKEGTGDAFWQYKAGALNTLAVARGGSRFLKGADLKAIYQAHDGRCYYCGIVLPLGTNSNSRKNTLSFDHVEPGVNAVWNLVPACSTCNMRKSSATLEELENMAAKVRAFVEANADLYAVTDATEVIAINTRKAMPDGRQIDLFTG